MGTPLFPGDAFQWAHFCNEVLPPLAHLSKVFQAGSVSFSAIGPAINYTLEALNPLWTKFIFMIFLNFQQVLVKLTYLQNHLTYFDYFFKEILLRKLSYFNA